MRIRPSPGAGMLPIGRPVSPNSLLLQGLPGIGAFGGTLALAVPAMVLAFLVGILVALVRLSLSVGM